MDYKTMYAKLFNSVTDAICILQKVQADMEEIFISQEETNVTVLEHQDHKDK